MALHEGVRRWSFNAQVVTLQRRCRHKKVCWVCATRGHPEGEGKHSSTRDSPQNAPIFRQDHYAILGVSSDASAVDIKLAFRQLARKYHPDVNIDSGAADTFKTIRHAYETLSNETSRHVYDHSLRVQARKRAYNGHPNRAMYRRRGAYYKQYGMSYTNALDDEAIYDWNSSIRREGFENYYNGGKDYVHKEVSESCDKERGPSFRQGWADSIVDVVILFSLVGFIWHTLGAQLALTYFVFFIPHNTEHSPWYRFASLMAWLIGGTKGLALQYGIVTTGWLYGKSHDMILALALSLFWMEAHFPDGFAVPRGALLLMAHLCIGGLLPR